MVGIANVVVPIIEAGARMREITFPDDWYPGPDEARIRYECEVEGIPALVELGCPLFKTQTVKWCLNPISRNVSLFDASPIANEGDWPGDAWGTAMIDRRQGFRVEIDLWHFVKDQMWYLLKRLPVRSAAELDDRILVGV